ncbi:MAG: bifunctional glutamate N-acetyltransferase/amino-acid acetyltransferase ArgJ [Acidimicrobiales bacterium]
MSAVSPLAPESFPDLPPVAGVQLATHAAGIKYQNRADLMLALLPEGTTVGGVFTQSLCPSAPVDWCRSMLPSGTARAIVCNSGNANAFTGSAGHTSARLTAQTIADTFGLESSDVYLASTGVIGETLPDDRLVDGLVELEGALESSDGASWTLAADAIRTTDTFAKGASAPVAGTGAVVVGIAKGSGMIAPDMATMLGFVFTDLHVSAEDLQAATRSASERSFNRITVDSDTSTSDTVLTFATAASGASFVGNEVAFQDALDAVMLDLAHQIVRDGEGASKFVEIAVNGAESDGAASTIALAIANSPLVKTALAAEDANWGRIVMAVGKAGERADRDSLRIHIGDELVASEGLVAPSYNEERATDHLHGDEVSIAVDVGIGTGSATVWTCDLTHGYIEINAGYRS